MSRTTDSLTCPFRWDADTNSGATCEGDACAGWDLSRSECMFVAAALALARRTDQPLTREDLGA